MARRINTEPNPANPNDIREDFLGRIVKYVPTEIVGLYLAATRIVPTNITKSDTGFWRYFDERREVQWWIFGLTLVLTPVYLRWATREDGKGALLMQVIVSTIAFVVWAFALGEPFNRPDFMASLILIFVTFILGLLKPRVGT